MSLNIEELKKAMYPAIMLSGNETLAYDYKIGITTKKNITFCYMMYYLEDDSYNFKFFRSLEELNKWEYNALYIFRITCEERHFEEIGENGYFKEMVSIIHSFRDNFQGERSCIDKNGRYYLSQEYISLWLVGITDPYKKFLSRYNFPVILPDHLNHKLKKDEMENLSINKDYLIRDKYLNISSYFLYFMILNQK